MTMPPTARSYRIIAKDDLSTDMTDLHPASRYIPTQFLVYHGIPAQHHKSALLLFPPSPSLLLCSVAESDR